MAQELEAALFVDGANWTKGVEKLKGRSGRINYNKIVPMIQDATGTRIVALYYYTAYRTQADLDRRWPFLTFLKDLGWQVQAMPAESVAEGQWRDKEVDIAIALDAYEEAISGKAESIMIGSGDGDFAALFRRLPEPVGKWAISFRANQSSVLNTVANVVHLDDLNVLQHISAGSMSGLDFHDFL